MKNAAKVAKGHECRVLAAVLTALCVCCSPAFAGADAVRDLVDRAGTEVSAFLDTISEVNCTERVTQERIAESGKTIEKRDSAFDYLLMLSNSGGELNLTESRVAADSNKGQRNEKSPLLVSNGFSVLLLVFHPYYSGSFTFSFDDQQNTSEDSLVKVNFKHIPGARSPAALVLRGREYSLDISGTAWIESRTGTVQKIDAHIGNEMEDIGLYSMHCDVVYAPISFQSAPGTYWLPARAVIEVESRHQHWRNTHVFSAYKHFSVNTKEQVSRP